MRFEFIPFRTDWPSRASIELPLNFSYVTYHKITITIHSLETWNEWSHLKRSLVFKYGDRLSAVEVTKMQRMRRVIPAPEACSLSAKELHNMWTCARNRPEFHSRPVKQTKLVLMWRPQFKRVTCMRNKPFGKKQEVDRSDSNFIFDTRNLIINAIYGKLFLSLTSRVYGRFGKK